MQKIEKALFTFYHFLPVNKGLEYEKLYEESQQELSEIKELLKSIGIAGEDELLVCQACRRYKPIYSKEEINHSPDCKLAKFIEGVE